MASSLIGRTLGKYEIIELLGRGGMATVYKGYQKEIDRYVAIKVLPPHPGQDPQFVERFHLEARTVARLQHPHILPVYDYGVEDDILYLVMAYVEGGTLSDRIDRGPMPLAEVEQLLRQVASALDYAHRHGVIHRDIKPDNILRDTEGHALLADFGIVKIVEGGTNLTGTGGLVGTPAYMAPEQGRGEPVSNSADIYSLGVVVYQMITGRQPYQAETPMQIVIKHMNEPVPSLSQTVEGVPAGLELVIQRVMAKLPAERYPSAVEFAEDFARTVHTDESLAGMQPRLSPSATVTLSPEAAKAEPQATTIIMQQGGSPLLLLGGFAVIAVLVVVVVVLLLNPQRTDTGTTAGSTEAPATSTESAVALQPTAVPVPTFGSLSYGTANVMGDTVTLRVENLTPPEADTTYNAWLQNTGDDTLLNLGEIRLDALGNGALVYTDAEGRPLPTLFNSLVITEETEIGDAPTGVPAYSGSVPAAAPRALNEILVTSAAGVTIRNAPGGNSIYGDLIVASGNKGGLLVSALTEAEVGEQHTGLAANATSVGGLHTHAEHTVNIFLGTQDDYDGNGRGDNPGRGFGVPRFLDLIEEQLDLVLSDEGAGASRSVQINAEYIRVCTLNVRIWIEQIVELDHILFEADSVEAVAEQALQAQATAGYVIRGLDQNENGQVEPFEGECGLQQIATYSILLGSIDAVEGPLSG
jgi:tRNA A-37 threonylcarbamoyl transferase component Bud32